MDCCCSIWKSACPARLGLTDLRFPLMWKDTDHFKNRGDYRRFAVFCLAKVGTEVMDTSLITPVDRSATDITFPDALVLWAFFFFLNSFITIIFLPIISSFLFACSRNWFDFSMLLFQTVRLPSQTSKWSWKCIRACCRMICLLRQHPASCKSHYTRPFPGRSAANYLPRWRILTVSKTTPCKYLCINQCSLPLPSWFCFAVGLTLMESSVIFFSFSFWLLLFVFSL